MAGALAYAGPAGAQTDERVKTGRGRGEIFLERVVEGREALQNPASTPEENEALLGPLRKSYQDAYWDNEAGHLPWDPPVFREHMRELRAVFFGLGGATDRLSITDSFFIDKLSKKLRFAECEAIIREVALDSISQDDPFLPRHYRDLSDIYRMQGRWSEAEKALQQAAAQLEAHKGKDPELGRATRLMIMASSVSLAARRGDWNAASEGLAAYKRELDVGGTSRERVDGYILQMRIHGSLQQDSDCYALWLEARDDPALTQHFESSKDGPKDYARLHGTGAIARAQAAWIAKDQTELVAALEDIEDAASNPNAHGQNLAWLHTRAAAALGHLGRHSESVERVHWTRTNLPDAQQSRSIWALLATVEARALLELDADEAELRDVRAALEVEWDRLISKWAEQDPRAEGVSALWYRERRENLATIIRLDLRLEGPDEGARIALDRYLEVQSLGSLARYMQAPVPDLATIQERLTPAGHGLLLVLLSETRMTVLCVDQQQVSAHSLATHEPSYKASVANYLDAIEFARATKSTPKRLEVIRNEVTETFFREEVVRRVGEWKSMSIVGLESIGYLPFEYLIGPGGEPLGCELALSYLPSIPVGLESLRRETSRAGTESFGASLFACPAPSWSEGGIEDLPFDAGHRELIHSGLEDAELQSWFGADASRAAFAGATFEEDQLLHIVLHGAEDKERKGRSAFVLAGQQLLTLEDFESQRLPPLVIFNACGANRSLLRRGDDGRHSLSGALTIGGTSAALMPQLTVDYLGSLRLTAAFTGYARQGVPVDEALRLARVDMVADPKGLHPSEYLLSHLNGWPKLILAPATGAQRSAAPKAAWVLGAALFGLAAMGFAARRKKQG